MHNMEPPTYLSTNNVHERDQYIQFDEGPHIYTVHGSTDNTSVTTWVHSHFSHFDKEATVNKILKSSKMSDPNYKYYNMTKEEIIQSWENNGKAASESGTKTHYHIECFYNKMNVVDHSVEWKYFMNFYEDHKHLTAYRTEWFVFHEELKLAGSIDMVFYNENTGTYVIYDWKRVKGITYDTDYNKYALTPCISNLPDTNFWHYALQLNVYRRILQEKYNMVITELALVVLHPEHENNNYEVVPLPMLDFEVGELWKHRLQSIQK